ncbi:hypothetical protein [Humibacter sp. RRB41]|uniref:hypothetical protein n=1 Tax=Humibacter sp. RRB41 TaxID=2919946 RepID=UPI001FAA3F4A|nr:hypothetical protein [Humibacter sp. RRB41]
MNDAVVAHRGAHLAALIGFQTAGVPVDGTLIDRLREGITADSAVRVRAPNRLTSSSQ